MTQKTNQNPWTMDVRVRERNLKSGALTDKDLEKYLGTLPDLADQAEAFGTAQPALAQPAIEEAPTSEEDVTAAPHEQQEQVQAVEAAPMQSAPAVVEAQGDGEGNEP